MFRGREMLHQDIGEKIIKRFCSELEDVASPEAPLKRLGRNLSMVIAPGAKKKPKGE
jgi:translation initiation factor IF-3